MMQPIELSFEMSCLVQYEFETFKNEKLFIDPLVDPLNCFQRAFRTPKTLEFEDI